jgi:hypothetical protein
LSFWAPQFCDGIVTVPGQVADLVALHDPELPLAMKCQRKLAFVPWEHGGGQVTVVEAESHADKWLPSNVSVPVTHAVLW